MYKKRDTEIIYVVGGLGKTYTPPKPIKDNIERIETQADKTAIRISYKRDKKHLFDIDVTEYHKIIYITFYQKNYINLNSLAQRELTKILLKYTFVKIEEYTITYANL